MDLATNFMVLTMRLIDGISIVSINMLMIGIVKRNR